MLICAYNTDLYKSTLKSGGHFEKCEMATLGNIPKILKIFVDDI